MTKRYWVYLIGNPEQHLYKIGISRDINLRMQNFRGFPFLLVLFAQYEIKIDEPGMQRCTALAIEKALHKTFKSDHLYGEWFKDVDTNTFLQLAEEYENVFLTGAK